MSSTPSVPGPFTPGFKPLRLLRLEEGEQAIVWVTDHLDAGRILGFYTRYTKDGSLVIPPEEREVRVNGKPGVWKGYFSAVVWEKAEKNWCPCVVEVTERSEQDFRGKIARGQVWKLSKAPKDKTKKSPLRALFLEVRPDDLTPAALDVRPKLRNDIYRSGAVDLVHPNPLPDLVVVVPVNAPAPGDRLEAEPVKSAVPPVKFSDRFKAKPAAIADALAELNGKAAKEGGVH